MKSLKFKSKKIFIIGAGGHTRSLINALELSGLKIQGIYDDACKEDEMINGYPLVGKLENISANDVLVLSSGNNQRREILYKRYSAQVLSQNITHPSAVIEKHVNLGNSNQILAGVFINSNVCIKDNNLINTRAVIEHESKIGSHNHISVGAIICGRASIGDRCMLGAGAVVIDNVKICDDVIIGANSVVIDDICSPGTYVGNPAKKIK